MEENSVEGRGLYKLPQLDNLMILNLNGNKLKNVAEILPLKNLPNL